MGLDINYQMKLILLKFILTSSKMSLFLIYNKIFYKYGKQKSHPTILWNSKVILKGILSIIFIIRKWNSIVHCWNCLVLQLWYWSLVHFYIHFSSWKESKKSSSSTNHSMQDLILPTQERFQNPTDRFFFLRCLCRL